MGRDCWKRIFILNVHTVLDNFCSLILFTHKNGGFDAISVTTQSCPPAHLLSGAGLTYQIGVYTDTG